MKRIITTVGTSIFENYREYGATDVLSKIENLLEETATEWSTFEAEIGLIRSEVLDWAKKDPKPSAEITCIFKILEEKPGPAEVCLIATDTILSRLAGEIIRQFFQEWKGITLIKCRRPEVIDGLQIDDFDKFSEKGLSGLFVALKNIVIQSKDAELILNISGGYKAVIPQLTILGQLYNIPLCYIHESATDLIWTSRLPVNFDWSLAEQYYPALQSLSQGGNPDPILLSELEAYRLIRPTSSGKRNITPFGRFFKEFIDEQLPLGPSVLGYFVEFKLFKHLIQHPFCDHSGVSYEHVEHSAKIHHGQESREVDLLLTNHSSGKFISLECKSYLEIANQYHKVKTQILSQLEIFKSKGSLPVAQQLGIYKVNESKVERIIPTIKSSLKDLKAAISEKHPSVTIQFIYLNIDLRLKNDRERRMFSKNPYQKFMKSDLTIHEISI